MSSIHDLNTLRLAVESVKASLIIIDKHSCLSMISQQLLLQEIAQRWYNFLRVVQDNAICPWLQASAEMELSDALFLITSIQTPDIESLQVNLQIRLENADN